MQYSIMPTCNIVICNTVILPICNILFLSIGNIVYFQYAILYCYEQFRQNQYNIVSVLHCNGNMAKTGNKNDLEWR